MRRCIRRVPPALAWPAAVAQRGPCVLMRCDHLVLADWMAWISVVSNPLLVRPLEPCARAMSREVWVLGKPNQILLHNMLQTNQTRTTSKTRFVFTPIRHRLQPTIDTSLANHDCCMLRCVPPGVPVLPVSRPRHQCCCAAVRVKTHLADRPLHQLPGMFGSSAAASRSTLSSSDGRLLCPVIGPLDDESLPFAVALELSTSAPPTPPPPVDSSTYALAYILEGRGHFTIADDASDVQHIQAGDTVLAPTNMGRYHSTVDPADADASPGSLARLLLVLPSEVFAADAEQPDAHTQSYQSVISTWKHWQACPTVGHLTQHDVHTLLSRRQPSELQAVVERETAPHSLLPSLTDWHTALTVSGRALLRGLHAALTPWSAASRPLIIKRAFDDLEAFQLPNQTNVLALVFDPLQHPVPFTFGVEIFQASHKTPPHVHPNAHEMFFILSGTLRQSVFASCLCTPPQARERAFVMGSGFRWLQGTCCSFHQSRCTVSTSVTIRRCTAWSLCCPTKCLPSLCATARRLGFRTTTSASSMSSAVDVRTWVFWVFHHNIWHYHHVFVATCNAVYLGYQWPSNLVSSTRQSRICLVPARFRL